MRAFKLNIIDKEYDIQITKLESRKFHVAVNGKKYEATLEDESDNFLLLAVDGGLYSIELEGEPAGGKIHTKVNLREREIVSENLLSSRGMVSSIKPETAGTDVTTLVEERELPPKTAAAADGILAPMPGKVVAVKVNLGDDVKPGDVVVILEAMKMENEITSNRDGKISEVRVKEGDSVDADDVLVVVG